MKIPASVFPIKLSYTAALLIISLTIAILYGRVLTFDYVWDDDLLFVSKTALLNAPLSWSVLTEPVLPGTSYMRPLVFLTFYIEFHTFGQSPTVSHAVNLLMFGINALLIFALSHRISILNRQPNAVRLSLLAAMIYVIHPALVESTAWISGRFDIMVTLFMLLACLTYLSTLSNRIRLTLTAGLMMLALLSKELGFVLPAVLICLWVATNARQGETLYQLIIRGLRDNALILLTLAATFGLYLALRTHAMSQLYHSAITMDYIKTAYVAHLLPLEALKFYLIQSVLPFYTINPIHPAAALDPNTPISLVGSAIATAAIVSLGVAALKYRHPSAWIAFASLICVVPVLHFIPLTIGGNIGHERFMTTSLAFLSIAVALLPWHKLFYTQRVPARTVKLSLALITITWAGIATLTTSTTLPLWSNELSLWNWAYKYNPTFEFAKYNYFYGAMTESRPDLVEQELLRLQKKNNGLSVPEQIHYANLLTTRGDPEGLQYSEGLIYALPKFHELPNGREMLSSFSHLTSQQIGSIYFNASIGKMLFEGNLEDALLYNKIVEWYMHDTELQPIYYQRAAILYGMGKIAEAESLQQEQQKLQHYKKNVLRRNFSLLVIQYCKLPNSNKDSCAELSRTGIMERMLRESQDQSLPPHHENIKPH